MSNHIPYSEKLKDPRWQKKRLEILNRDSFTCQKCGDTKSTLHIHHIKYQRGLEPWEYNDSLLSTLCCHCHEVIGKFAKRVEFNKIEIKKHERWESDGYSLFFKYRWDGPREDILSGNIAVFRDNQIVDILIFDFEELDFFNSSE